MFIYQAMFCGTASTIISGAVAERLKFGAYLAIVVLVSGIILLKISSLKQQNSIIEILTQRFGKLPQ